MRTRLKGPFRRSATRYVSLSEMIFFFRLPSMNILLSFTWILMRSFGMPGASQMATNCVGVYRITPSAESATSMKSMLM